MNFFLQKVKAESENGGIGDSNKIVASAQETETAPSNTKSPKRLSKAAHNTLSEIFRKIGSKENTKEVITHYFCLISLCINI